MRGDFLIGDVVIEYSLDGVTDTYTDTNAARLLTGPPGLGMVRLSGSPQANVWVDDYSVDNLVATGSNPIFTNSGGWPCLAEYLRRRKKTPEQLEYERRMDAWRIRCKEG